MNTLSTAIHLICHRRPDDMGLTGLSHIEGGVYRSISWELDLKEAKSLEGGWVYFHPTKADPSYFGGEVVRVELSGGITARGNLEVALIIKARKEGRGQKWRGAAHGMAWTGDIVNADLPHEGVEGGGTMTDRKPAAASIHASRYGASVIVSYDPNSDAPGTVIWDGEAEALGIEHATTWPRPADLKRTPRR